ncbi:hypothetical protein BJF80_07555 [Serinicoccus sp. CUA-874]|nr:hypothetical protein BJF80_07555 [Serinicoccus sp. CUA-874]
MHSALKLVESTLELRPGATLWRARLQPAAQYRNFLGPLASLAMDDGCLLRVPRRRFTAVSGGLSTLDCGIAEFKSLFQLSVPLQLLNGLDRFQVVHSTDQTALELLCAAGVVSLKRLPNHACPRRMRLSTLILYRHRGRVVVVVRPRHWTLTRRHPPDDP